MGPAALNVQAPCTLELSRSQPCLGASGMLLTPPSSPVSGRQTNYMPDWKAPHKMSQWRPPYGTYPFQEPLQHALSIQHSRTAPLPLCGLQTAFSEPPAMHAADGEQVVPQRVHESLAETAVPSAAADWVAPPILPQAAHRSHEEHSVPVRHRAAPLLQPSHHRVAVQAAPDHQLAPSSPSPMEQGRVLPEFGELVLAAQRQPQPAMDVDVKQKAGCSWLSMTMDPQGAAPLKKEDLQQPLSSLESVGTPLGRHSPAPEAAPVMSTGQQAESPHAHEQAGHVSTAEPDLPPKKRRHVREMTPPPLATHHWAPLAIAKPVFEVRRGPAGRISQHEEQQWDAVVPKRQRRHRLVSGDSSSSSSAAAFEHRPVITAEAPANLYLEAHSTPQKAQSDPLCMLLDAAEELSHHEDYVTGPTSRSEHSSREPRSLQEAWAAGDMAVYPYAKSLATKTSISGLVIQKEWVTSLMEPNEHKNNTAVSAVTDSGQVWPITFYLNKDRRELRGPPDGQPGGWANLRRALNAQPTDVAVLWKEYGMAHRSFRLSVLPKSMVPQGIHLAP